MNSERLNKLLSSNDLLFSSIFDVLEQLSQSNKSKEESIEYFKGILQTNKDLFEKIFRDIDLIIEENIQLKNELNYD